MVLDNSFPFGFCNFTNDPKSYASIKCTASKFYIENDSHVSNISLSTTSLVKKWSFRTFVHCRLTFASLLAILERNQTFSFRIEQRKVWAWFLKSIAKMVMKLKINALGVKHMVKNTVVQNLLIIHIWAPIYIQKLQRV